MLEWFVTQLKLANMISLLSVLRYAISHHNAFAHTPHFSYNIPSSSSLLSLQSFSLGSLSLCLSLAKALLPSVSIAPWVSSRMALVTLYFTCLLPCHVFPCTQRVGLATKVTDAELIFMAVGPASSLTMECGRNAEMDPSGKLERSGAMAWRMRSLRMNCTWYQNGWPRVFQVKRMCMKTLERKRNTICEHRKASRFLSDGVENRGVERQGGGLSGHQQAVISHQD